MTDLPYDSIVLISFGGPDGPDDVLPFLQNVTAGRGVPPERLAEVGEQYAMFGGVSPINAQNRALIDALRNALDEAGIALPIAFGNRNWHPLLTDTVAEMRAAGHRRALGIVTSAFGSYSGCRQYREDIAAATDGTGLTIDKAPQYWRLPGFLDPMAERVRDALAQLGDAASDARLVFTAHSIPTAWVPASPYVGQLRAAAGHIAAAVFPDDPGRAGAWDLVYQSRSGPPQVPWLEPDINDHLRDLHRQGVSAVVVVPVGFVSDHMEVMFDLDTQARATADDLGMSMVRAGTVGTHPDFVGALRSLVEEALGGTGPLRVVAEPGRTPCSPGCCDRPVSRRPSA